MTKAKTTTKKPAQTEQAKARAKQAETAKKVDGKFKIDAGKGGHDGTVSKQWMSRPDDQKFLDLASLEAYVTKRTEKMTDIIVPNTDIQVVSGAEAGQLLVKANGKTMAPTNYGFNLLCYNAKAPAGYLRTLPADLAAQCVTEGFRRVVKDDEGQSMLKLYGTDTQLYSVMSSKFGRILDKDVVQAVRKLAGNGTGDTRWKVPGQIDWSAGKYTPFVDITKDTTTLYASDRDIFMFLVDDTHPIEVGKLDNGEPDLMFRGFYVWQSEMGGKALGISTFMLRGVCQNRNLWGVEDQMTLKIRHTKLAPQRFVEDFNKTLIEYSNASAKPIVDKVKAAKALGIAKTDEERIEFLTEKIGLSKPQALAAVKRGLEEEGRKPENAWDFCQALTALARYTPVTDERVALEKKAATVMDRVKVAA